MQPNKTDNYWQPEPEEAVEMYAPQPIEDELIVKDEPIVRPDIKSDDEPVHWRATEYIHEEKNKLWFVTFAIVVTTFVAVDILLLKSYTFSVLVIVMAISVVIHSRRPPKEIDYTLSGDQGLYIGETLHHFSEFKAFGYIRDNNHNSIMLIPVKRFSIGVSVYFPEEVGEKIIDILGARLPMNNLKLDMIDIIVRKLRL